MTLKNKFLMAAAGASGGVQEEFWINVSGGAGNEFGRGVTTDSSDNIIVCGLTTSDGAGSNDLLVAKYSSTGTLLWDRTLGGTGDDQGHGVTADSSDNIIVVGHTTSDGAGGYDLLVAKYSSTGTLLWAKTLGGTDADYGYRVTTDSSDNIIVCGLTTSDGAGSNDLLVAKYSSTGTLLWDRTLGGTGVDFGYGVTADSSDNIVITGYTYSDGVGSSDLLVVKYSSTGTLLWGRTLGGTGADYGYSVTTDSSDNIIVTGSTTSDGAGGDDLLVAKYSSAGTLLWARTLGGAGVDQGYGVTADSSDNIIVTGYTTSDGAGGVDFLVVKYSSAGTLLWDKTLGGAGTDFGLGVVTDSSDNIIVTGYTTSDGAGGVDFLVAKLPPDGSLEGTYGPLTYQDAVFTDAEAVLTDAPAVLTDATAVLKDEAAVLTEKKLHTLYTIS